MELHKPEGFRTGAAIDFKQIAMGNQRKQNHKIHKFILLQNGS